MIFLNRYIFISLLATFGFFYGLLLFMSDYGENKCEMTYMFQYPQFVRISMKVDNHFKKYGLFSYSEGHFTERARKMQFSGIPVLFVPGNAGSYKQVRSLASIALRKALNSRPGFHFDYFTIDFNEELTGLNGALLQDQVTYVQHSIYRILELYSSNINPPVSIVLVGHSMGGIIAEGLLSKLPNTDVISLVITLASPHKRPPLLFDIYLKNFYDDIKLWDNQMNTTFITVFGGFSDFLVAPNLASSNHLSVATTHVPKTWLPTDHLCILWCKQLVLVLNRALFDSVDPKTKQISQDKDYIMTVFRHHLLHNSGIKMHSRKQYDSLTPIDNKGEWIEYLPRQYTVHLANGARQPQWYMVRVTDLPLHEVLSVMSVNLELTNWVYACSANEIKGQSRVCIDAMHLTHKSEIVPSLKYKRRFLNINLHKLHNNFSHVVVKIPTTVEPITLYVDVHSEADRKLIIHLPTWSVKEQIIVPETSENTLYYEIHFPNLNHITQSYRLFVQPFQCKAQTHHANARFSVPWSNHDHHAVFTETQNEPMDLELYATKPIGTTDSSPYVKLLLDPDCRYRVSVKLAIPNMLSQFARFYSSFIFTNVAVIILLTLKSQLASIGRKDRCSLFFTALMTDTKPFYVVPVSKIATLILSFPIVLKVLPQTDIHTLDAEGLGPFSMIFLYILSIGITWILAMALAISIFCFELTVNNIFLKILSKSVTGTMTTYDWVLKGLKKFPSFVAILLLSLSMSTCGGLALCLGLIFYYLKLTQLAQDVVENIVIKFIKIIARKLKVRPQLQEKILRLLSRNTQRETNTAKTTGNRQTVINNKEEADTSDGSNINSASTSAESEIKEIATNQNGLDNTNDSNENVAGSNESANAQTELNTNDSFFSMLKEITENNELYFHFTLFCLWFLVTCINIPTVLTWAHNFKYSSKLHVDPSSIPGAVLCTCAVALWQFEYPKISKKWYKELSYVVYILTVFSYVYGMFSVYRLNYVLTSIIALVTLHQLLAPNKPAVVENGDSLDDDYTKVKAKLE